MHLYILFNKPYGVLCQFSKTSDHSTLGDFNFPKNVYSAGRLDADSEGLLLLTDDGTMAHRLLDPKFGHQRTYWIQVERVPSREVLDQLEQGIVLDDKKTKKTHARLLADPKVHERKKPIRFRRNIPTAWIELSLTEGRNRQARRMTAAVGHPTLRLIRSKILFLTLDGLQEGEWRFLTTGEIERLRRELEVFGNVD